MTASLLPDANDHLLLRPDELISLADAGVSAGAFAMRPIKKAVVQRLLLSTPQNWPPILVTCCDKGYAIVDGYHRHAAARVVGEPLKAICQPFPSDNAVIEAAFEANLTHGQPADTETRSNYAYWLHVTYPQMTQADIAKRAHIGQSSVSEAIAKREERVKELMILKAMSEAEQAQFEQQKQIEKACRAFLRAAFKFLEAAGDLDDVELLALFNTVSVSTEDRAKLARLGRLLSNGSRPGSLLRLHASPSQASLS